MAITSSSIHVAVGVVRNAKGEILIARRPQHVHQGGLWEFPGGKVEAGESVQQALARELDEELGIQVDGLQPLIRIAHAYPDRRVLLDVWQTDSFSGQATGREGQPVRWVSMDGLEQFSFPRANHGIIRALQLPDRYLVSGDYQDMDEFSFRLEQALHRGIRLLQFRDKHCHVDEMQQRVPPMLAQCHRAGAKLLLNGVSPALVRTLGADGLHLTSAQLHEFPCRPLDKHCLLAASVHDQAQLQQALKLEVDFVVVSPVQATASHPGAAVLGWEGFAALAEASTVPVYALGGMEEKHITLSRQHGGQGISAIRALWGTA